LQALQENQASLRELRDGLERYPQVLVNVPVREKISFAAIPALQTVVERVESELGKDGRLLLRYSGTELLARVMIEGASQYKIEEYAKDIADVIRQNIGKE
jgi:phosphoglucosamine mutase